MSLQVKNRKKLKVAVYCLMTAATFWFFNEMGNRFSTDVHFPVRYELSEGLVLEESTDYIFVSVSGTGWRILNNQLGFKIDPVRIRLAEPGRYEIKTIDYAAFIRSELDGIEMKQVFTENLSCVVKQEND
jgi:hypothetical protein